MFSKRTLLCWVKISPWGKVMTSTELHGIITLALPCRSINGNHKDIRPRIQGRRYREKGRSGASLGKSRPFLGPGYPHPKGEEIREKIAEWRKAAARSRPQRTAVYPRPMQLQVQTPILYRILASSWATSLIFVGT